MRSGSVNYYEYVGGFGFQQRGTYGMGQAGNYWSSTPHSSGNGAYNLNAYSSSINSSNYSYYRYYGYSLRCLAS